MKNPQDIEITEFDYDLPSDRIAKFPLPLRDQSKLLVYQNEQITIDRFQNLHEFLWSGSALVFNNTKVICARLLFENNNQKEIEIFCLEPSSNQITVAEGLQHTGRTRWNCLVGNLRRWKQEQLIVKQSEKELKAKIITRHDSFVEIEFEWTPVRLTFSEILQHTGKIPIPPYLNREAQESDDKNYQTVYSSKEGSVAAPTAGLHFTKSVFSSLNDKNISRLELTLHVGAGTFKPIKSETLKEHHMHSEWIDVEYGVIKALLKVGTSNIIAVGTTSLRTLESLYWMGVKLNHHTDAGIEELEVKQWDPYIFNDQKITVEESLNKLLAYLDRHHLDRLVCRTGILIAPPYEIKMVKGLITNFHQPKSTLLLLVAAFTNGNWRSIYNTAMASEFRFLSYGDSSLLIK